MIGGRMQVSGRTGNKGAGAAKVARGEGGRRGGGRSSGRGERGGWAWWAECAASGVEKTQESNDYQIDINCILEF